VPPPPRFIRSRRATIAVHHGQRGGSRGEDERRIAAKATAGGVCGGEGGQRGHEEGLGGETESIQRLVLRGFRQAQQIGWSLWRFVCPSAFDAATRRIWLRSSPVPIAKSISLEKLSTTAAQPISLFKLYLTVRCRAGLI